MNITLPQDIPAIIALLIGLIYTLPQLRKSFKKNATAKDIALGSWWLLLIGEFFWGANALVYKLPVNLISCAVNIILITTLLLRLLYLKNRVTR